MKIAGRAPIQVDARPIPASHVVRRRRLWAAVPPGSGLVATRRLALSPFVGLHQRQISVARTAGNWHRRSRNSSQLHAKSRITHQRRCGRAL